MVVNNEDRALNARVLRIFQVWHCQGPGGQPAVGRLDGSFPRRAVQPCAPRSTMPMEGVGVGAPVWTPAVLSGRAHSPLGTSGGHGQGADAFKMMQDTSSGAALITRE